METWAGMGLEWGAADEVEDKAKDVVGEGSQGGLGGYAAGLVLNGDPTVEEWVGVGGTQFPFHVGAVRANGQLDIGGKHEEWSRVEGRTREDPGKRR